MEDGLLYDRYGWQSSLGTFARCEPRVVRLQLQFVADASPAQVRAWRSDLLWAGDDWSIEYAGKNRPPLKDPLAVGKNVYRVLMTRGRDSGLRPG
jgi:hypothetical protein